MIDHFGGSDRRHPDPAVWRTLPAKILPVCGTAGRCGSQRSEASSHLRLPGAFAFCGWPANMCSSQKNPPAESRGDAKIQKSGAEVCPPPAPFGVSFLQVCLPHVFFAKNWQENQGGYGNAESGAEVCPPPALSKAYLPTCGFPHKKIPRRESRGIFIRHLR